MVNYVYPGSPRVNDAIDDGNYKNMMLQLCYGNLQFGKCKAPNGSDNKAFYENKVVHRGLRVNHPVIEM